MLKILLTLLALSGSALAATDGSDPKDGFEFPHSAASFSLLGYLSPTTASIGIDMSGYAGMYVRITGTPGVLVQYQFSDVTYASGTWYTKYASGPGVWPIRKDMPCIRFVVPKPANPLQDVRAYVSYALIAPGASSGTGGTPFVLNGISGAAKTVVDSLANTENQATTNALLSDLTGSASVRLNDGGIIVATVGSTWTHFSTTASSAVVLSASAKQQATWFVGGSGTVGVQYATGTIAATPTTAGLFQAVSDPAKTIESNSGVWFKAEDAVSNYTIRFAGRAVVEP